jgi:hypothetical protein
MTEGSYADLIGRLTTARVDHTERHINIWAWYAQQCTAAEVAVAQAEQNVTVAASALATAQSQVDFTRAESERLWWILAGRLGLRNPLRLGPPPGPGDGPPGEEHPGRTLERLRDLLDEVGNRRRRWSRRR